MRWVVLLSTSKLVRSGLHQFGNQVTIASSAAVSSLVMQYLLEQPPVVDLNCLEWSIINMLSSHYINLRLLGGYAEEGAILSDGTAQKSNRSHDWVHGCLYLPPAKAHGPNWYANYRPFLLRCFSMNECRTMCHCHQYNHKENLSYDKTSKSMLENRCCRPRMSFVDPNKRTSGSSAGITLASLQWTWLI